MSWEDFDEYKTGNDEYDITNMDNNEELINLYNLLKEESGFNLNVIKNEEDRSNTGETSADS